MKHSLSLNSFVSNTVVVEDVCVKRYLSLKLLKLFM